MRKALDSIEGVPFLALISYTFLLRQKSVLFLKKKACWKLSHHQNFPLSFYAICWDSAIVMHLKIADILK